jgi:hypothetical protein
VSLTNEGMRKYSVNKRDTCGVVGANWAVSHHTQPPICGNVPPDPVKRGKRIRLVHSSNRCNASSIAVKGNPKRGAGNVRSVLRFF